MSGEDIKKTTELVARAEEKNRDVVRFSTGVELKIKEEMNPSVLIDILADLEKERPEAPVVYIEDLDREEINLDDPEYTKRLNRWETASSGRIADALVLIGTETHFIPEKLEKPEGNEWIGMLEVLGFKLNRRSKAARYLAWVKHVAIQTVGDWELLTEQVGRRAGVSQADVKLAQDSFPDKKGKR